MERLSLFIDNSNFYHGLKETIGQTNINFRKFINFFSDPTRVIVSTFVYSAPLKREGNEENYRKQQSFFDSLRKIPFLTLKLGRLNKRTERASLLALLNMFNHQLARQIVSQFGEERLAEAIIEWPIIQEKGVNVNLAIDMVIYRDYYDTAILVSGDEDFVPAIRYLRSLGKRVEAAYFLTDKRKCSAIRMACDKFIILDENSMRTLLLPPIIQPTIKF